MSKKRRMYKKISESLLTIIAIFIVVLAITMYMKAVNQKALELSDNTVATITITNRTPNSDGFYEADIKNDLLKYIKKNKSKDIKNLSSFTYKIEGEKMYFVIQVNKKDKEYEFELSKIVDEFHDVNAKLNYQKIEKIEYRTGNGNYATVLNLISKNDSRYLVFAENNQQFLGPDIESISYINDHFYYLTYNPNYSILRTAKNCSEEIKESIDNFNSYDEYYSYGKINFLQDYYQKTASTKYSVKERCEELEKMHVEENEEEKEESKE